MAAILGLASLAGRISSPDTKLRNQLAQPVFAPPAARHGMPRPPRKDIGSPMNRAGIEVPHPAPAKPHLTKGRPLGAAIGNGGDARLPRRLHIEW